MFKALILSLSVVFSLSISSIALGGAEVVTIYGMITTDNAMGILRALETGKKEYRILINSEGGEVIGSWLVVDKINALRRDGKSVDCIVTGSAFSMALYIYNACGGKYAVPNAKVMFHRLYVMGWVQMTAEDLEFRARDLRRNQELLDKPLKINLKVKESEFLEHQRKQTVWPVTEFAKWSPAFGIKIINDLGGRL